MFDRKKLFVTQNCQEGNFNGRRERINGCRRMISCKRTHTEISKKPDHLPNFRPEEHHAPYVTPHRPQQNFLRPREYHKDNRAVLSLDSLVSTPKEILATKHQLHLLQPPPLVGVPSKENLNKNCDYNNEKGNSTNDCFHLKRQLEIALESGKLNHLVKDVRQKGKGGQKRNGPQKEKIINMVKCVANSQKRKASRPKAAKSNTLHHLWDDEISNFMENTCPIEEVLVNLAHPDQLVTISKNLSREGFTQLKNLLKDNKDVFAWEPSDMTGVPKRIIKHTLNANHRLLESAKKEECSSQKKARCLSEKGDGSWRMYIDFKNINSTCLKDYNPLPEIDHVAETFDNLRRINVKLNPKKCSFGWKKENSWDTCAVLMVDRKGRQCPMFYVSKNLHDAKRNYAPLEKVALALLYVSRRLRRYFEAHPITVIMDQPIKKILNKAEASRRLARYSMELRAYNISYEPHSSIKGQILADFINEVPMGSDDLVSRTTPYMIDY
nr:reverse transcriptase domain-containing protein [Tanacetum cinerariifolium]